MAVPMCVPRASALNGVSLSLRQLELWVCVGVGLPLAGMPRRLQPCHTTATARASEQEHLEGDAERGALLRCEARRPLRLLPLHPPHRPTQN
eukprot:1403893-Rhodomonas_salina.1